MAAAFVAGMHGIAGAVERADREVVVREAREEIAARGRAGKESVEIDVRRARPVAAGELQHVHVEPRGDAEHRIEISLGQAVGDHSDLHRACTARSGAPG
jgi:hypothetical protein